MKPPSAKRAIVWWLLLCGSAGAADLQERTRAAYDHYADEITKRFLNRARGGSATLTDGAPSRVSTPRDGEVVVRPGSQDGIIVLPGGLLHHWRAASFMAGVTLEDALAVS